MTSYSISRHIWEAIGWPTGDRTQDWLAREKAEAPSLTPRLT